MKKHSTAKKIVEKGKERIENAIEVDNKIFTECLNYLAGLEEGRYVLNRLMCNCGQDKSSIVKDNDGRVDTGSVEYMEGKRSIWLFDLKPFISVNNLKNIMFMNRRKICQAKKTIQQQM